MSYIRVECLDGTKRARKKRSCEELYYVKYRRLVGFCQVLSMQKIEIDRDTHHGYKKKECIVNHLLNAVTTARQLKTGFLGLLVLLAFLHLLLLLLLLL